MNKIKWDDKYFRELGLCVWIFNNGQIESTNEDLYMPNLLKIYYQSRTQSLNNIIISKKERE